MGEFIFNQSRVYKDKSFIKLIYEGELVTSSNIEELQKLLEIFLDKGMLYNDMVRNVTNIRTILNDLIEKKLIIEYEDDCLNNNCEFVEYKNGVLTSYKFNKYDENIKMEFYYLLGNGIQTRFFDKKCTNYDMTNNLEIEKTKELSNQVLNQLVALNNAKKINLDNDSKAIIEAYKLFYNEDPDFTKKDINLRVQTMVLILKQFNYFGQYKFSIQDNMIESFEITSMVNKLFPLGKVTIIKDSADLSKRQKCTIKIAGETIREYKSNELSLNEILLIMSKTIYAGRFDINSSTDVDKLLQFPDLEIYYNEVIYCIKLVNIIQERVKFALTFGNYNSKLKKILNIDKLDY